MGFTENLSNITGTQSVDGIVRLIDNKIHGQVKFINSGVGLNRTLKRGVMDFEETDGMADYFGQGKGLKATHLNLPANSVTQGPHMHPGGEFAYVIDGAYFDADMSGRVVQCYPRGTTVFYTRGSTHRPLSSDGAELLYIPFDSIVFGKSPEDLAGKMVRLATAEEAIEYALLWMIPDARERQTVMDRLAAQISTYETLPIPFHSIGSFFFLNRVALMSLRHRLLEDSENINFSRLAVG